MHLNVWMVCHIEVEVIIANNTLKTEVTFRGDLIRYKTHELFRSPVRGEERKQLPRSLRTQLPRALHLERLSALNEEVYASGCRDGVPTPGTLKSIYANEKVKARHHQDDIMSLT